MARPRLVGGGWRALGVIGVLSLLGLGTGAAGEPTDVAPLPLTVADSVALALSNNRNIESAYLDRVRQRFDLEVAEDKFVPDLDINVRADLDFVEAGGTDFLAHSSAVAPTLSLLVPTGAFLTLGWINGWTEVIQPSDEPDSFFSRLEFGITQPLLRGGGIEFNMASVERARLTEQSNRLQLNGTVINTVTSVVQAHRAALLALGRVDISRRSLDRAQRLLEVNQALVIAGRLAEDEILQADANVSDQALSLIAAEDAAEAARLQLLDLLDIDTETRIEPVGEVTVEEVLLEAEELLDVALRTRTDYLQAQISIETAKLGVVQAENNRLWDLDLSGAVLIGSTASSLGDAIRGLKFDDPDWRISLTLRIPFGDLTREQGVVSANIALDQAELRARDLRDGIELAVRDGVRNAISQWSQLEQARRARELNAAKLEIEREKLNLGLSSSFQVVTFENDLANSEVTELSAKINYLNALTRLDQTLGTTLETWNIELVY